MSPLSDDLAQIAASEGPAEREIVAEWTRPSREMLCEAVSASTGNQCQQPERWLEHVSAEGGYAEDRRVCQVHGRQLERQGWRFVRELHPVPGFERTAS